MFKSTMLMKLLLVFVGAIVLFFVAMLTPEFFREATRIASEIKNQVPLLAVVNYWFIGGIYACLLTFIAMLGNSFRIVQLIERQQAFSTTTTQRLKWVRNSAFLTCLCFMVGIMPMIYSMAKLNDAPGVVIIGFIIGLAPMIIALVAAIINKVLIEAIAYKTDSELTV